MRQTANSPRKSAYVIGPPRYVQGVHVSSALRATPILRDGIWRLALLGRKQPPPSQ